MKYFKIQKIASPILLLVIILLVFLIFARIRNISLLLAKPDINVLPQYIYLFLLLIAGIVYYIINTYISKNYLVLFNEKEKYVKELNNIKDKKDDIKEEIKEKSAGVNEIINSLMPDVNKTESIEKFTEELLLNISKVFNIVIGIIYLKNKKDNTYSSVSTYAYYSDEPPKDIELGISLNGQAAKDQKVLILSDIPDNYLTAISGLGKSNPSYLLIAPVVYKNNTIGIIEVASFKSFDTNTKEVFITLCNKISDIFNKFIK